jgi:hypothetical protein
MKIKKIKKIKITAFAIFFVISAATFGSVGTAQAEDFTFTVPVRLSNMLPEVREAKVICNVYAVTTRGDRDVGRGNQAFSIPDSGNFSENVVVRVSADEGHDPSTAVRYACELTVLLPDGSWSQISVDSREPQARPKPGTPFNRKVVDRIP